MARPLFDATVPNLLLVAAVSGAGKSTFIQQLRSRRLPGEVLEALPDDCASWVAIDKRTPRWQRIFKRETRASGQILECDVTYSWARQSERDTVDGVDFSIEQVPDLADQLQVPHNIFAVIVCTPQPRLIDQLAKRSVLSRLPPFLRPIGSPAANALLRLESALPENVPRLADKALGKKWRKRTAIRQYESRLLQLYAGGEVVGQIQKQFEKSLRRACGPRAKAILHVEPTQRGFRLLDQAIGRVWGWLMLVGLQLAPVLDLGGTLLDA